MQEMEEQLRATNRMIQELNALVHHQVEVRACASTLLAHRLTRAHLTLAACSTHKALATQNTRRYSRETTPSNVALQPRTLGPTYSVARIAMDVADSSSDLLSPLTSEDEGHHGVEIDSPSSKKEQVSPAQDAQPPKVAPFASKKASMGLAVLNAELPTRPGVQENLDPIHSSSESRRGSKPTAAAVNGSITVVNHPGRVNKALVPERKFHLETPLTQRENITRHLSTRTLMSTEKAPESQRKVRRRSRWSQILFKNSVSPEELLVARDPSYNIHRYSLRHDSSERYAWDILVMVMILIEVVLTPLSIGFGVDTPFIRVFNAIGSVIFAADFVVQMLSSYTDSRGKIISGPRNTARNYLLSVWAIPDFLGWFPFEQLTSPNNSRAFGITKVIRLAKVSQLARRLHSAKKAGVLRFVRLLGIVFVTSHVLSCYWYFIADEWKLHIHDGAFVPQGLGDLYALCWSLIIGCLNASPPVMYTATEAVSVGVFMLVGNLIQASVFGAVAVLISSFDEEEASYNQKLITVYERCKFLGIPDDLMRRIRGYYENLWRETKSISCDADAFINELSPALICEVKFQLYRDMLTQIPFLSAQKVSPTVIEMLILHLRTVIYMQDDVLIRKGEVGDWMGFIGSKGSVGVLDPSSQVRKFICILRKGDYFGEMALLQRAKRSTTAVALSWVQIHVLCRADLDNVKEQYPTQAEVLEDEINKYMQCKVTYR